MKHFMKFLKKILRIGGVEKLSISWVGYFDFFFFIPMKISHKSCVWMDGTQFLLLWWFTAKNERENHKWAWVYYSKYLSFSSSSQLWSLQRRLKGLCSNQTRTWWMSYLNANVTYFMLNRKCVSTGAAGARTLRSLGHHLLHPRILRLKYYWHPWTLSPRGPQIQIRNACPATHPFWTRICQFGVNLELCCEFVRVKTKIKPYERLCPHCFISV